MYKRILLKLSGEALAGTGSTYDAEALKNIAQDLKKVHETGAEIAIVVGGGNVIRGKFASQLGLPRVKADQMGMLATLMNALAVAGALQQAGVDSVVQTAIEANRIADIVNADKAIEALKAGKIVVYGGGTSNPYFSTDSTTALRAAEIGADAILMAKNGVDGVYSADPGKDPTAVLYKRLTFQEILDKRLGVMDLTAAALCQDNNLTAIVFNMKAENIISRVMSGEDVGTTITVGK